jgi:protein phosphatase
VRQNNEDSIHLWAHDHDVLAVVADGMGGAVAGEEASRIAIDTIRRKLSNDSHRSPSDYRDYDSDLLAGVLGDAVKDANQNIISKARNVPELRGMGTTLTLAFARGGDVTLVHVGDSRAYYIDGIDGSIRQITSDHSFVQALVDAGHITQEEAEDHPMKNVLYRALGQAEDLDVDVLQDVQIHVGDRLVLCSDGLTLHVNGQEIAEAALEADDPHVISDNLVELANERGGKDNVSVIVIVVEPSEEIMESVGQQFASQEDDEDPTHPFDPDLYQVTHSTPSQNTSDEGDTSSSVASYPTSNDRQVSGAYGEGHDSFEPLQ